MALIASGAYNALQGSIPWSIPLFMAGFGLLLALAATNRRYRHSSDELRRSVDVATTTLNASLLAGILIVVNVIAFRYGGRPLDFTKERTHSLSSLTVNQLSTLTRPLRFTLVFGQGPRAVAQRERVVQLLELYRAVNPSKIQVEAVLNPFRAEETLKRVPDLAILQGGGVLLEYGEGERLRTAVVRNRDMFPPAPTPRSRSRGELYETVFTGEDAITSALLNLREAKKSRVAFTTGHGEPSINELSPQSDGLGIWKSRLSTVGCDVNEIDLLREDLPDGLALLAIVAPRSPFKAEEVAKIRSYADRRGPLLLILGNGTTSGLEDLLRSYHLELGKGVAADLRNNLNGLPRIVVAVVGQAVRHPIVNALVGRRVLVPEGAPIRVLGPDERQQRKINSASTGELAVSSFLLTGPESWSESEPGAGRPRFDRETETPGPLVVGAAVVERTRPKDGENAPPDETPRLVLLSSRAFAGNPVVELENTNLDLVMNAASWLRGRPDAVGISPSTHQERRFIADPALRIRLVVVPTVTAIIVIIGGGIAVYVLRRE
jgi:hypothetical protein